MAPRPRRSRTDPERRLVIGVAAEPSPPGEVRRRFLELLRDGARLRPAGTARRRPERLLTARYLPRHQIHLFDTSYFLAPYRFDDSVGFFVGYVALRDEHGRVENVWPRYLYKDSSLLWRVASHFVRERGSVWIGKGEARLEERGEWEYECSAEETANLPYELQNALDELSRFGQKRRDERALSWIVRQAPRGRIAPYADFSAPRRRAARRHAENGGRPVARFLRRGDPASLTFAPGYEPDLARGIVERGQSSSAFFGGRIRKFRVLSTNRRVQYLFFASPTHVWLAPPQLLTAELSSYGVRTLDVAADEDAFLPGFEYHEEGDSQIPPGFAGAPHPDNPGRADAARWLEALPIVRAFREQVLARRPVRARTRRARVR